MKEKITKDSTLAEILEVVKERSFKDICRGKDSMIISNIYTHK